MKRKSRVKVRYNNVLKLFLTIILIFLLVLIFLNIRISNIYITGNNYLTDVEVIKSAKIENYPSIFKNTSSIIKKRLLHNQLVKDVKISYSFTSLYINIEENYPLFYNSTIKKTVLCDKTTTSNKYIVPYLINYIPDSIYDEFINCLISLNNEILLRISEIKYDPNDLDEERFYLIMNDGNYVYININNFSKLNKYEEILEKLSNKKGILYLDSGEYFEITKN